MEVARKGGVRKTLSIPLQRVDDQRDLARGAASSGDGRRAATPPPMAQLGIEVAPLDRATAQQFDLPDGLRGVVVAEVRAGGPAFEQVAGPQNGGPDIILKVEGKRGYVAGGAA